MSLPKKLAFVDIETTGMRPTWDRVIEIGILRVEDGVLVNSFQSLINPQTHLPPEITVMTGITYSDLESAPTFRQVHDEVLELITDCIFVAHNARFDYAFVKNEFRRLEKSFNVKPLCSAKLSRILFPRFRHHNLDSLIERFSLECPNRHRAFDDAKVIFDFYQKIQTSVPADKLSKTLKELLKKPSVPSKLSKKDLDNLPDSPGVYIFYGEKGAPLYIGKSINIKDRVASHFNADHSSSSEMKISQTIESIEAIKTCGELGALLLESALIKKIQPLYNRKLRNSQSLIAVKSLINEDGYQVVTYQPLSDIPQEELGSVMGVFRSQKAAKDHLRFLAGEHQLCEKLLGLENTKSGCFGYRLGKCNGACLKKEKDLKYNLRFWEAFAKSKLRRWPFEGAVLIKEYDPLEQREDLFIVDEWCVIESSMKNLEVSANFDLDAYRILNKYLASNRNVKTIQRFQGDQPLHAN